MPNIFEEYVSALDNTEQLREFSIWSLISVIGASLGRRTYLSFGSENKYPNFMIYLVGNAATRKTTAVRRANMLAEKILVNMAPHDTAGRRQGLLQSFRRDEFEENDDNIEVDIPLNNLQTTIEFERRVNKSRKGFYEDNSLYLCSEDLTVLFGGSDAAIYKTIEALHACPDKYNYRLSTKNLCLNKPCLSVLGAIRPLALGSLIPKDSYTSSILNNTLLVYSEGNNKHIAVPTVNKEKLIKITKKLLEIKQKSEGEVHLSEEARTRITELYKVKSTNVVLGDYYQRKQNYLLKTAMVICAADLRKMITISDINLANEYLTMIEPNMEFAYSEIMAKTPIAHRQLVKDLVVNSEGIVALEDIIQGLKSNIPKNKVIQTLAEMVDTGQLLAFSENDKNFYHTPLKGGDKNVH